MISLLKKKQHKKTPRVSEPPFVAIIAIQSFVNYIYSLFLWSSALASPKIIRPKIPTRSTALANSAAAQTSTETHI